MSRSQSFPFELSSLRKRSAKLVQGTTSNFISVPVFAVKPLDSSTSAFAGSHAAQQRVNCFDCARAGGARASIAIATSALARAIQFSIMGHSFWFTKLNLDSTLLSAAVKAWCAIGALLLRRR